MAFAFQTPVAGPKAYIARGSSGWPETFVRKDADAALLAFLGAYPLAQAVEEYRKLQHYDADRFDWATITAFLASLSDELERDYKVEAAISFWVTALLANAGMEYWNTYQGPE